MAEDAPLFDYVLVLKLDEATAKPIISYRFPPSAKDSLGSAIMLFCFPESEELVKSIKDSQQEMKGESFSFVLTQADGSKRFGYCRRFSSPPNAKPFYIECYCILSFYPAFGMFTKILEVVETRRRAAASAVFVFLKTLLSIPAPGPGGSMTVTSVSPTSPKPDVYTFERCDSRDYLKDADFATLFKHAKVTSVVKLFGSLLLERRIILMSSSLHTLSRSVGALAALLNPFAWQHVYIPVLPKKLMDYCCAPMPFLVGILTSFGPMLKDMPLEEVLLLDLDKDEFALDPNFPDTFPKSLEFKLTHNLEKIVKSGKEGRDFDVMIARCMARFLYNVFGGYANFINNERFDLKAFNASHTSDEQLFLGSFEEAQMWNCFIHERVAMAQRNALSHCLFSIESKEPWPEWEDVEYEPPPPSPSPPPETPPSTPSTAQKRGGVFSLLNRMTAPKTYSSDGKRDRKVTISPAGAGDRSSTSPLPTTPLLNDPRSSPAPSASPSPSASPAPIPKDHLSPNPPSSQSSSSPSQSSPPTSPKAVRKRTIAEPPPLILTPMQLALGGGQCGKCGASANFFERAVHTALGKMWHENCFLCYVCAKPISKLVFSLHDSKPHHPECQYRK